MKKLHKYVTIVLIVFFAVLILLRLFDKIDAIGMMDFDESKHAVEAYEMFSRKAWIAHTYYWEIDYMNSKPPLYYWLTNIFFSLFGVSIVNFKLPSAISGLILCVILSVFLYKTEKKRFATGILPLVSVPLFLAGYLAMDGAYDFHGFRAGNFDGVYTLFLLVALIFAIRAREDNRNLIPMGAFMGLAFLAKGFNTTSIVFCAICSIPFLAKEKRIKYILYSILTAIIVVLPWAALRFKFDGTQLFYHKLFSEAEDKLIGGSFGYFWLMVDMPVFWLLVCGLVFYLIATAISERSIKGFFSALLTDLKENALFWIWFWVPIVFYSWAGTCNDWYIYSSFVLAALLFAIYFIAGVDALSKVERGNTILLVVSNLVACILLIFTATYEIGQIKWWHQNAGMGGGPAYPFWSDMREIKEKYGDEYQGSYVFMEDISRYNGKSIKHELFYDILAYAEYEGDWRGVKGGIDAWENAEEGILVINKDIADQFMDRLAGHVIIHDNGYLYFIHDFY